MPQLSRNRIEDTLRKTKVVDLFCGVGGMTHGFVREGFEVVAGIDIDETCRYAYERNNCDARFLHKDIADVEAKDVEELFGKNCGIKVLIGCAPCQPFSQLNINKSQTDKQMEPLKRFGKLIDRIKPDIVSMENVKELAKTDKYPVFKQFLSILKKNHYHVDYRVVDCSRYGIPQNRKRLVLLASRLGKISLIPETHFNNPITVRQVIGSLEHIEDGTVSRKDPLHRASRLSPANKKRIAATPPDGGSIKDWRKELMLKCHKKPSGRSYSASVYGRMRWDAPAPTMTTNCTGLGNGRFGHPEQNRAISLREAALFQTFPKSYRFFDLKENLKATVIAKHIGNAVPVRLGEIIAISIKNHIASHV